MPVLNEPLFAPNGFPAAAMRTMFATLDTKAVGEVGLLTDQTQGGPVDNGLTVLADLILGTARLAQAKSELKPVVRGGNLMLGSTRKKEACEKQKRQKTFHGVKNLCKSTLFFAYMQIFSYLCTIFV